MTKRRATHQKEFMVPLESDFGMENCRGDHDFFLMWVNWLSYFALGPEPHVILRVSFPHRPVSIQHTQLYDVMRLFEGTQWDRPPRCERCGELESACQCPPAPPAAPPRVPPDRQRARIAVEKRARGKVVTVVRGLAAQDNDLADLLTRLKNACGAGGTVKDDLLEIQGEHRDRIAALLADIGYRVSK